MTNHRIQLTLFVNAQHSESIETVRKLFNPVQYGLIKAHVTLCREDELPDMEMVMKNLNAVKLLPVSIEFGLPVRFADQQGVMLPAKGNLKPFHLLRKELLKGSCNDPRLAAPHITLMHPRNSFCDQRIFEKIAACRFPSAITFDTISLIEQEDDKEWQLIREFRLR